MLLLGFTCPPLLHLITGKATVWEISEYINQLSQTEPWSALHCGCSAQVLSHFLCIWLQKSFLLSVAGLCKYCGQLLCTQIILYTVSLLASPGFIVCLIRKTFYICTYIGSFICSYFALCNLIYFPLILPVWSLLTLLLGIGSAINCDSHFMPNHTALLWFIVDSLSVDPTLLLFPDQKQDGLKQEPGPNNSLLLVSTQNSPLGSPKGFKAKIGPSIHGTTHKAYLVLHDQHCVFLSI